MDNICICLKSEKLCDYIDKLDIDIENLKTTRSEYFYVEIQKLFEAMFSSNIHSKNILSLMLDETENYCII